MKKIRCFYWKMRDRGKGRQVKVFAFILCLTMISMVGLIGRSLIASHYLNQEMQVKKGASTDASKNAKGDVGTDVVIVSGSAVSGDSLNAENAPVGTSIGASEGTSGDAPVESSTNISIDTSGLDSFLGFMTDHAYEGVKQNVISICQTRQCTWAKKLNYQQTSDGTFDVASFILLSDGCICQCDYNLKSDVFTVNETNYSEADITAMSEAEQQAEQEALKKQQEEDKKKAAAEKKKSKKSSSKKKSTKGKSKNK